MYSAEEKAKAIKTYLENNCNAGKTVRELGYPTVSCMIKWAKEELYRAHLEKEVYEKAAEILKKEMGDNLKDFFNREKAMVIVALRDKYPIKGILAVFDMAKSSYCYRRIHVLLRREGIHADSQWLYGMA